MGVLPVCMSVLHVCAVHLEFRRGHQGTSPRLESLMVTSPYGCWESNLGSLACPGTYSVDQIGLELRDIPASASQLLGLKTCATTAQLLYSCFMI